MSSLVNNKKFQPVLIVLVLGLWAFIGYKAMNAFSGEDELQSISIPLRKIKDKAKADIWKPSYAYADPFLKFIPGRDREVQKDTVIQQPVKRLEVKEIPTLSMPIQYTGFIQKPKEKDRLGIFTIHDQTFLKKTGELIFNIQIKGLSETQAILVENGHEFVIDK